MTTRLNITLTDVVAEKLRAASGNKPSEYIERAVTRQMLADDLRKLAEWERSNPSDQGWEQTSDAAAEEILFGRPAE
ncbi:hypothetical protein [Nocardia sp. NPDC051832]|uniref:hypothetical protein n=1 Tax=Nocardia sp. NPDC051832 TaxID=3155673 RepID=UPI0034237A04